MEYGFEIQHRLGQKHLEADAISSLSTDQPDKSNLDDDIPTYKADEVHAVEDNEEDINAELLTVKSFVSAQ